MEITFHTNRASTRAWLQVGPPYIGFTVFWPRHDIFSCFSVSAYVGWGMDFAEVHYKNGRFGCL